MARRPTTTRRPSAPRNDIVICGQRMDAAYAVPAVQPAANGTWRLEPDKLAWTDPATGYPCIIRRELGGHLAAYVGLPLAHPLYGYKADAIPADLFDVPGGLDYAAPCDERGPESRSVCHVADDRPHDDLWWLGRECNRISDLIPDDTKHAAAAQRIGVRQTYRDAEALYGICTDLAARLKTLELEDGK
jgi:hypothetical protein